MTQLELPPISFARYLDLLKRRRWQVIPMSLLGLVVGGVIAFFIPRYYVAGTTLVYTGAVLDAGSKTDSLYQMVRGAEQSVKDSIPKTAESLQWVGTNEADQARQATLDQIKLRTTVNAYQRDRESSDYTVTIEYRDPDGVKAARFANELRDTWIADLMHLFNEIAASELRLATSHETQTSRALDDKIREINNFRRDKHIERGLEEIGQSGVENLIRNDLRREEAAVTELQARLLEQRSGIDYLQQSISEGSLPRTIIQKLPLSSDPQLQEQVQALMASVRYFQLARDGFRPGSSWYESYHRSYEAATRQLLDLAPQGVESGFRTEVVENPDYVNALRTLNEKKASAAALEAQLGVHQRALASLQRELDTLPELWREYEVRLQERDSLIARLRSAEERADGMRASYERARTIDPFTRINRAMVPPAPTEPNVTLVALAGSLLGLAAAIGLVLLLDILRASFKTVDDVSYALKMPVLGVMSHLETDEVRTQTVRQRRIVAAGIAVFLALVLSIVTVYYVAPTRLPPSLLQLLHAVLGGAERAS